MSALALAGTVQRVFRSCPLPSNTSRTKTIELLIKAYDQQVQAEKIASGAAPKGPAQAAYALASVPPAPRMPALESGDTRAGTAGTLVVPRSADHFRRVEGDTYFQVMKDMETKRRQKQDRDAGASMDHDRARRTAIGASTSRTAVADGPAAGSAPHAAPRVHSRAAPAITTAGRTRSSAASALPPAHASTTGASKSTTDSPTAGSAPVVATQVHYNAAPDTTTGGRTRSRAASAVPPAHASATGASKSTADSPTAGSAPDAAPQLRPRAGRVGPECATATTGYNPIPPPLPAEVLASPEPPSASPPQRSRVPNLQVIKGGTTLASVVARRHGHKVCIKTGRRSTLCHCCKGGSLCKHGRQKYKCKQCKGSSFCKHKRQKSRCKQCKGTGICEHSKERWRCAECRAEKEKGK